MRKPRGPGPTKAGSPPVMLTVYRYWRPGALGNLGGRDGGARGLTGPAADTAPDIAKIDAKTDARVNFMVTFKGADNGKLANTEEGAPQHSSSTSYTSLGRHRNPEETAGSSIPNPSIPILGNALLDVAFIGDHCSV